jgi:hypothetical protein
MDQQAERCRRHVLARFEDLAQLADRALEATVGGGHVAERVGVQRDRRVDVLRREHSSWPDARELTRVFAGLVVAVHHEAHELGLRVIEIPRSAWVPA